MLPSQADSDAQLIALWLHGRSRHTQRAYAAYAGRLRAFVDGKALGAVPLGDLQAFSDTLSGLSPNSRKRIISVIKSLLAFGHRIGYLTFNVGAALSAPRPKNTLAERI